MPDGGKFIMVMPYGVCAHTICIIWAHHAQTCHDFCICFSIFANRGIYVSFFVNDRPLRFFSSFFCLTWTRKLSVISDVVVTRTSKAPNNGKVEVKWMINTSKTVTTRWRNCYGWIQTNDHKTTKLQSINPTSWPQGDRIKPTKSIQLTPKRQHKDVNVKIMTTSQPYRSK